MRTRRKISIDRWLGLPMVWVLNLLARGAGALLTRDHSVAAERTRTIAVAKCFGMGSIVQATPLLRALRQHYPNAHIVFVSARANAALLARISSIDTRLYVDDASLWTLARSTLATLAALWRHRIDLYFDLEVCSAYASAMALLSIARNRVGLYRYSAAFKRGIYTHLIFFNARQPIRSVYLQLGRAVGVPASEGHALGPLLLSAGDRRSLARALGAERGLDLEQPYVVINPNASDLLLERRWPAARFAALAGALARDGQRVLLIGSGDEAAHTAAVRSLVAQPQRDRVTDTAGRLTLPDLLALLSRAACVVSNDTGPMHMAIALRRPTVCLFGPCSPDHYGIAESSVAILYHPVFCSPCVHEVELPPCAGNNVCMQLITVEEVLAAVRRVSCTAPAPAHPRAARAAAGLLAPAADEFVAAPDRATGRTVRHADSAGRPLGVVVRATVTSPRSPVALPS